ncbi:MAG: hypothetical protein M3N52_10275, partial [Actinomycetota bacterium]|nr:hypothetical protein [Actinomycetota bacterium]
MHHRGSPAGELHLTLDDGREQRDVTVTVHRGDATLGDLAASAGWATSELVVDGAPRPVELTLADAGVGEGSLVAAPQASRPTSLHA